MIEPDNFAGDPYQGGLNQMGHAAAGAAVLWIAALALPMFWAVLIAGSAILALEIWQLWRMGAGGKDYAADLWYWFVGVCVWAAWPELLPPVLMGCFALEYTRIKWAMRK